MEEDRLLCDFLLQHVKCLLGCCCSYEGLPLFGECVEGQGYLGESCDEGTIKVTESMKGADVLNTSRGRPVVNPRHLG